MLIGVLHPGQMGAAIAGAARSAGHDVQWCAAGRSPATAERAAVAGLRAAADFATMLATSEVVFAICPPAAAEELADRVASASFHGIYVEANAISVERSRRIAERVNAAGARAVDAAIIGPPPSDGRSARLYVAGPEADSSVVAAIFEPRPVEVVPLAGDLGAASALKMAFASYQKAARALAAVAHALGAWHGVTEELLAEARRMPHAPLADPEYVPSVAARAWRWAPEMLEVAETLCSAGLPTELSTAAAAVLSRWEADRDDWTLSVDAALTRLAAPAPPGVDVKA